MASESTRKSVAGSSPVTAKATNPDRMTPANGAADESADAETDRQSQIAVAAYYKAKQRGFAEGHEIADWLAAEQEVDAHEANRSGHSVKARY
jgi:hypothetical protein